MNINPPVPLSNFVEDDWVDLDTASNDLARHWGLGPEHAQCFRMTNHCTNPECKNLQVALIGIHKLHHQCFDKLSKSVGVVVLKSALPHGKYGSRTDGPYVAVLADGQYLMFDKDLPLLFWLKALEERHHLAKATASMSKAISTGLGLRL